MCACVCMWLPGNRTSGSRNEGQEKREQEWGEAPWGCYCHPHEGLVRTVPREAAPTSVPQSLQLPWPPRPGRVMSPKGRNQHSVSMPGASQPLGTTLHRAGIKDEVRVCESGPNRNSICPQTREAPKAITQQIVFLTLFRKALWHVVLVLHTSLLPLHCPTLLFVASPLTEGRKSLQAACPVCEPQPCGFWDTSQPVSSHLSPWAPNIKMPESLSVLDTENTDPVTFRIPIFAAVMHTDAFSVLLLWLQRDEEDQRPLPLLNIYGGKEPEPSVFLR